jgi:hypothetical protein
MLHGMNSWMPFTLQSSVLAASIIAADTAAAAGIMSSIGARWLPLAELLVAAGSENVLKVATDGSG